ncbi:hypothetical protein NIES2100_19370 [Calothrix sp. NIES-2100]|uniref:hypothetical protein n=1 Tax=Calothrix sp. NIES-2100 TaxID=1954172 RepID=UPI000B61CAA3|nr:hypothetical protein NIES2100_19370 [Calothrix sp. NIES-2100]
MNRNLLLQELAIAIAAKNLNPTVLNPDFLKYTGVVPSDWELGRSPVYANGIAQITFSNGLSIVAQSNRIVIAEAIGNKELQEVQVAQIACQLVEKLPKVEYQSVGINPVGLFMFDSETQTHQYLCQYLLSRGSWQEFGEEPLQAGLQLAYTLKRGQLILGINQAKVQYPDKSESAIVFSGNFNYPLSGNSDSERLLAIQQLIQNWQDDLKTFRQLLEEKFLPPVTQPINIFPKTAGV